MFGKKKKVIGLDIGSSQTKMVELSAGKTKKLVNYGISKVLSDAIVEGEIIDREAVLDSIRSLIESKGFTTKNVVIGLAGRDVIIKRITMDRMSEADTREQIKWEAEQYVPFDINEVSLDFDVINPNFGDNQQEVILVAAKNEVINNLSSLLKELNLNPVIVDTTAFAIQNVFEYNYAPAPDEIICLLHIGAGMTVINVIKGGSSLSARDVYYGVNAFISKLQKEIGFNYDDAINAVKGTVPVGASQDSVQGVFESFISDLGTQIERSLQFLASVTGEEKVNRMYLSGGGALIPNLLEYLKRRLGVPIELINPFKNIIYDPAMFGPEGVELTGSILAQATGLALRGE
ncbi:type IV pilus assembly protein PilM [candidate division WOR-3 bacterium]|jgi:type IV pilus assembly protein PilM|nr:type IV pilus assembly protein PilM [candidate division WOR-3 bacterium]